MEARQLVYSIRKFGLTQVEIANRTGIPQPTISKIERGEVADIMSRSYRALQELLGELINTPGAPPVPTLETAAREEA